MENYKHLDRKLWEFTNITQKRAFGGGGRGFINNKCVIGDFIAAPPSQSQLNWTLISVFTQSADFPPQTFA